MAGDFHTVSFSVNASDRDPARSAALVRTEEEETFAFLEDTRPDADGLYTDGNIDLRSLVSSSCRAVEVRAETRSKKRRRVAVKTEEDEDHGVSRRHASRRARPVDHREHWPALTGQSAPRGDDSPGERVNVAGSKDEASKDCQDRKVTVQRR